MTNIRALASRHVGRPVIVHSAYGVHRGILHHIDNNGMYLQLNQGGTRMASAGDELDIDTLDRLRQETLEANEVFWPFFFIPFAAAFALSPWWYGPYGW